MCSEKSCQGVKCSRCARELVPEEVFVKDPPMCMQCARVAMEDIIEKHCLSSDLTDPMEMAKEIVSDKRIAVHGPHHHFLVPAVLLSAYCNKKGLKEEKEGMIRTARERASHILGGFCGTHGDCGTAVGIGISVSIITGATPLSEDVWDLGIIATAQALMRIGKTCTGPRCCKRNMFIAIEEATEFFKENLDISLDTSPAGKCPFVDANEECIYEKCPFI